MELRNMTSSNGHIFRVTGPLCRRFTGHRWIPLTKASDAELWCFHWSAPWVNNREAGDLRRHRTHYDVIVMEKMHVASNKSIYKVLWVEPSTFSTKSSRWIESFLKAPAYCVVDHFYYSLNTMSHDKSRHAESRQLVDRIFSHPFYLVNS